MRYIEEGGWIIPHFILSMGVLRFPPDSRGMCMDIGLHDLAMDFPLDLTNGRVIV